jgi:hypothetical protein
VLFGRSGCGDVLEEWRVGKFDDFGSEKDVVVLDPTNVVLGRMSGCFNKLFLAVLHR